MEIKKYIITKLSTITTTINKPNALPSGGALSLYHERQQTNRTQASVAHLA